MQANLVYIKEKGRQLKQKKQNLSKGEHNMEYRNTKMLKINEYSKIYKSF